MTPGEIPPILIPFRSIHDGAPALKRSPRGCQADTYVALAALLETRRRRQIDEAKMQARNGHRRIPTERRVQLSIRYDGGIEAERAVRCPSNAANCHPRRHLRRRRRYLRYRQRMTADRRR